MAGLNFRDKDSIDTLRDGGDLMVARQAVKLLITLRKYSTTSLPQRLVRVSSDCISPKSAWPHTWRCTLPTIRFTVGRGTLRNDAAGWAAIRCNKEASLLHRRNLLLASKTPSTFYCRVDMSGFGAFIIDSDHKARVLCLERQQEYSDCTILTVQFSRKILQKNLRD